MTRRTLLLSTLSAATLADIAAAQDHAKVARNSNAPFRYLTANDAREIEAITAQIIPSDGTPGAREAGCIHFIDRALETFDQDKRGLYRAGLAETEKKRVELFPQSHSINDLSPEQAIALLKAIEQSEFFKAVRTHTVMGFLSPPEWGGNQATIGWKHIGMESKMMFEHPFGYYDAKSE